MRHLKGVGSYVFVAGKAFKALDAAVAAGVFLTGYFAGNRGQLAFTTANNATDELG